MPDIITHFKAATVKMWYRNELTDKRNRTNSHETDLG